MAEDPDVPGLDIQGLDVKPLGEERGMLSKGWHAISDPLTTIGSRTAKKFSDYVTDPNQALFGMHETGQGGLHDYVANTLAKTRGFTAGAAEGVGNLFDTLTSPLSIATLGLGAGEYASAKAGLPEIANAMRIGGKMTAAPVIAHGATSLFNPESSMMERGQGLVEMAGGSAAMMHAPPEPGDIFGREKPKPIEELPQGKDKEKFVTTKRIAENATVPEGTVPTELPEGTTANLDVQPLDKFAKFRTVPVGTTYKISPSEKLPTTITEAKALGFEYQGLDDDGKMIIRKTRESPAAQTPEPLPARSLAADIVNLPRTLMASFDVSAPLRQGLGLINKKAFWNSLPSMFKAFGSEEFYNQSMDAIAAKPLFRRSIGADGGINPSFAEKSGLKLSNMLNQREESIMSGIVDKVPGIGGSERAYTLFLNKLRADTFEEMVQDFGVFSGQKPNTMVASQIADFINNASGRGSLTATIPFSGGKQVSLEKSANALSTVLFSPRLIASRLQMMGRGAGALFDPQVYMSSAPNIRREYIKSLMSIAAATQTFVQLARMAGASVESDPASADFGKVKMGNTRIDPYGGFQQYIVLAQRMLPSLDLSSIGLEDIGEMLSGGKMKSTISGREYSLDDPGFGRSNRADILSKFIRSKTNPIVNLAWGMFSGMREAGGKKMDMTTLNPYDNAIAQRFIPMFTQDVYDLVNDETTGPAEKGLAGFLASLGAGVQTYGDDRQR